MKGVIDRRSLCDKCVNGLVAETSTARRYVHCRQTGRRMFDDVTACTGYSPIGGAGFWMNGWAGQAHSSEAQIIDPRPRPGQHL